MATVRTCYRHPDRETGLSCSECGRPICAECMTPAAVGLRCPDHSGKARGVARVARAGSGIRVGSSPLLATHVLVTLNVLVYLITVAQGGGINAPAGSLLEKWILFGPWVADGEWWRLLTSAFLHANLIHLGLNMLGLWWLGSVVERALGTPRYLLLYLVSGLAGSAGALLLDPLQPTLGASGAIYGILGALLVLEYSATGSLAGNAMTLIVLNLAFTLTIPNISIGGHLGGLAGGVAATALMAQFRRSLPLASLSVVAVGLASVAIAYWKVRGYA